MESGYDRHRRWDPRRAVELLGIVGLSGVVAMGCSDAKQPSGDKQVAVCDIAGENLGKLVVVGSEEAKSHPEEYSRNLNDCLSPLTSSTEPSTEFRPSR